MQGDDVDGEEDGGVLLVSQARGRVARQLDAHAVPGGSRSRAMAIGPWAPSRWAHAVSLDCGAASSSPTITRTRSEKKYGMISTKFAVTKLDEQKTPKKKISDVIIKDFSDKVE